MDHDSFNPDFITMREQHTSLSGALCVVQKLTKSIIEVYRSPHRLEAIVLFHNIFFSSGEQPKQRIAAHKF